MGERVAGRGWRRKLHIGLAVFWTAVLSWMFWSMQARGVDDEVLVSSPGVEVVSATDRTVFRPVSGARPAALVFYPGALVEPAAYAPMARDLAEAGHEVVVLELPWRLAPTQAHRDSLFERTRAVLAAQPDRRWIVGGHSRGGALAARFAWRHPEAADGLLLVGTSHPREDDLSGLRIPVTKVYASEDGLASVAEVEGFAHLLPASTRWVEIAGGNHRQFGWYGYQIGDGTATISRVEQQRQLVRAALQALRELEAGPRPEVDRP